MMCCVFMLCRYFNPLFCTHNSLQSLLLVAHTHLLLQLLGIPAAHTAFATTATCIDAQMTPPQCPPTPLHPVHSIKTYTQYY